MQEAFDYGIVDVDSVYETLMATKREKVKRIDPFAITPPHSEGGRWQTYYKDEKRET